MTGYYDLSLVFLSYLIAILASYSALYFGSQLAVIRGARHRFWLALGALAMGLGVWTMHFVGMRAHIMPVDMSYDLGLTLVSVVPAVLASGLALLMISRPKAGPLLLAGASVIMGSGIAAMHYTGMAAMKLTPGPAYDPLLVAASVLVAVGASSAALAICRILQGGQGTEAAIFQFVAALIMAAAICGMHYVGMAAVSFPSGATPAPDNLLSGDWLGLPLGLLIGAFILMALIASALDLRRYRRNLALARQREHMNAYDEETGLPNRASLDRALLAALAGAGDRDDSFGLIYLEMSNFRSLTEGWDEARRRTLLTGVAKRLRWCLGDAFLGRYAGNAFMAIVPGAAQGRFVSVLKRLGELSDDTDGIVWQAGQARHPQVGSSSRRLVEAATNARPVGKLKFVADPDCDGTLA